MTLTGQMPRNIRFQSIRDNLRKTSDIVLPYISFRIKQTKFRILLSFFILLSISFSWFLLAGSTGVSRWTFYNPFSKFKSQIAPSQPPPAKILDRTLVLPAFTYARDCEYDDSVCAPLTPMFIKDVPVDLRTISNRTWYPDPDPGQYFIKPPITQPKGWVIPIENLLDVDHLISTWGNAIRLEDFFKLTNPDPSFHSIGLHGGNWNTDFNLNMSYRKMPNSLFTDSNHNMVDRLPKPITPLIDSKKLTKSASSSLIKKCQSTLQKIHSNSQRERRSIASSDQADWDESLIQGYELLGNLSESDNPLLESCLASSGFRSAYTMNNLASWMKASYRPIKVIKNVASMVGWWDRLHQLSAKILHVEGEIHNGFPPGSMMWTSLDGRKEFERLTRTAVRPPEWYHKTAARLELKIRARCAGRSWVGAHMRRGDFLSMGWAANDIAVQWKWIESHARAGANVLKNQPDLLKPSHQVFGTSLEPPQVDDPIYLSSNARSAQEIGFLRAKNVILLSDLLDEADRLELGFSGKFTDTLSVLEQCLMMRAGYYFGDAQSSVDGWVLNRRVFYGISEQVTSIEYFHNDGE